MKDTSMAGRFRFLLWLLPVLFLFFFFISPLVNVFFVSFQKINSDTSIVAILDFVKDPLSFSFVQASVSTILTILIGFPIAYVFSHFNFFGKRFLQSILTLPFILPTVVVAAAFNSLIGPKGWINLALMQIFGISRPPITLMNTFAIIIIAHLFYNLSIFVRIVASAWSQLNLQLEQAAQVLGATPWKRFWKITFPLLKPSFVSAILMVFLFDFTSFGVILLLGGPRFSTLEVGIYLQTTQLLNLFYAGILSILQIIITYLVSYIAMKTNGHSIVAFLPDVQNLRIRRSKSFIDKVMIFLVGFFIFIFFFIPELGLFLRSFIKIGANEINESLFDVNFSFDFYKELFINRRNSYFYVAPINALMNSLLIALVSAIISTSIGTSISIFFSRSRKKNIFQSIVLLPLGTSSVTLGLGFLLTFSKISGYQQISTFLLPIAHSLISLPLVISVMMPALSSIPNSLRESALLLGADPAKLFWLIDFPLTRPSFIVSTLFAFVISFGEFGATSFLARPHLPTLPIAIYRYLGLPGALNYGQAMAMAVIIMIVCYFSMIYIEKLIKGQSNR